MLVSCDSPSREEEGKQHNRVFQPHWMKCIHVRHGLNKQINVCKSLNVDNTHFFFISARPQGKSYLFFTQFKAELKGTKIEYASAFVSIKETRLLDANVACPVHMNLFVCCQLIPVLDTEYFALVADGYFFSIDCAKTNSGERQLLLSLVPRSSVGQAGLQPKVSVFEDLEMRLISQLF